MQLSLRKRVVYSIITYEIILCLALLFKLSFASTLFNALLFLLGFMAFLGLLIALILNIKPKWFGLLLSGIVLSGSIVLLFIFSLMAAFYPWRSDWEDIQGNLVCRTVYDDSPLINIRISKKYILGLERQIKTETLHENTTGETILSGCPTTVLLNTSLYH